MNIEIIDEIDMSIENDEKIRDGLCISFPEDKDIFGKSRYWNGVVPELSIVLSDENLIIAHIAIVSREIMVGENADLNIFGIQNVYVLPNYRGKGILNSIMYKALEVSTQRAFDCGLLFCLPSLEKVYEKYGWKSLSGQKIFEMDENGNKILKEKGLGMYYPVQVHVFPQGDINLMGRSW